MKSGSFVIDDAVSFWKAMLDLSCLAVRTHGRRVIMKISCYASQQVDCRLPLIRYELKALISYEVSGKIPRWLYL